MSHTPSVRTEADGGTTVDAGLTAATVQTPQAIADPTSGPILAAVVPDDLASFALDMGTYQVSYVWQTTGGGETSNSPPTNRDVDGTKGISVTVPTPPAGATGTMIFFDNATESGDLRYAGLYIPAGDPLTVYLPVMNYATWAANVVAPQNNGTGPASILHSELDVQGPIYGGGSGIISQDLQIGRSVAEWNAPSVPTQPEIAGALSAVTDAAAKALLTSIIAVLVGKGSASDGTT